MSREFETLHALIAANYEHNDHTWTTVAVLEVLGLIDQYYEVLDDPEMSGTLDRGEFAAGAMEDIYETLHSILVHQTIPMTDEQRIAEEDQLAAEFREAMDGLEGKKILNLQADENGNLSLVQEDKTVSLDDLFQPKKEENNDE